MIRRSSQTIETTRKAAQYKYTLSVKKKAKCKYIKITKYNVYFLYPNLYMYVHTVYIIPTRWKKTFLTE